MRTLVLLSGIVVSLSVAARHVEVRTQTPARMTYTESVTNVPINVVRDDVRVLVARVELDSGASNVVQVAFGRDFDGDGDLAVEETDLVLGWQGASPFVEHVDGDERILSDAVDGTGARHFLEMTVRTDAAFVPESCAFTNEAGSCFADVSATCPPWIFGRDWNLLKVTRRGRDFPNDVCRIAIDHNFLYLSVR